MKKKTIIILVLLLALILAIAAYFIFRNNQVSLSPPARRPSKQFPSDPKRIIEPYCWKEPVGPYPDSVTCTDDCALAGQKCLSCCKLGETDCNDICATHVLFCKQDCNRQYGQ